MRKVFIAMIIICISKALAAQDMTLVLHTSDANCNGAADGSASLNVTGIHPPFIISWSNGQTGNAVNELAVGDYTVVVQDSSGNDTSMDFHISERICQISAEIDFTPNNDGFNDTWYISNIQYYPDNLILVYNRWGQKVFEHSGAYQSWDGRDPLGKAVPDNAYFYVIYPDRHDKGTIVKGTVNIIR